MAEYELPAVPHDDSHDPASNPAPFPLDDRRSPRLADMGLLALSCLVAGGAAFLMLANSRPTVPATQSAQLERQARLAEMNVAAEATVVANNAHD